MGNIFENEDILKEIDELKQKGITILFLSTLSGIDINTLYSYTSQKRKIPQSKETTIRKTIKQINQIINNNTGDKNV